MFYHICKFFVMLFFIIFYRHRAYGLTHIPKGAAIMAPNHVSYYDPPLVAVSTPGVLAFLARKSLFHSIIFGGVIRALNAYPVSETSSFSSLKAVYHLLKKEKRVLIFPEGTRTFDGQLASIQPGIVRLAFLANVPIVPIFIYGTYDIWPRQRRLPRLLGKTACVFGTPIYPAHFQNLDKQLAQKEMMQAVYRSIKNLETWYANNQQGDPP